MRLPRSAGGWPAILYTLRKGREGGGLLGLPGMWRMWKALRSRNACKTCALGMGGQLGGMVNEEGHFPEVCKKSIQAMAADLQGRVHPHFFADFSLEALRGFSPRDLEHAGRLVEPVIAGSLDSHYRAISWDEALERIGSKLRANPPQACFLYLSGRSSNEAAFLAQLFARVYGTNHVSNCSFYCHQASGVALSDALGTATATVTLEDVERADLLILAGGNPASNHPRFMRTLVNLKRRGGQVVVVNPLRELGLVNFRVPSDPRSLLFGSTIADEYLQPHIGGDVALFTGIAKAALELGAAEEAWISAHTHGGEGFMESLRAADWTTLEQRSGVSRATMERVARLYARSKATVFAWTMGLTHHVHGVENVQALINLALLRGMVGRPHAGLLPLRGHSNVQGVGSMGVAPKLRDSVLAAMTREFGIEPPAHVGLDTLACLEQAAEGRFKVGICLGGNLYGATPDAGFAARALARCDLVVYLNTTLNTGHACGRGRETIILPVLARDEERQPTTQESMFNYVRLSDGGPPRHADVPGGGPRSEVDLIVSIAELATRGRVTPQALGGWSRFRSHDAIRGAIARVIPGYGPVADIGASKREFQIPGRTVHAPPFATEDGRARFVVLSSIPEPPAARGDLALMTIRSEGQFNTVVYEEEDIYRGQERRDVILLSGEDIRRLGLHVDQRVTVASSVGTLSNVLVREVAIRPGNSAMYYPEANVLVPRTHDPRSKTPAYKSVVVTVRAETKVGDVPVSRPEVRPRTAIGGGAPRKLDAC